MNVYHPLYTISNKKANHNTNRTSIRQNSVLLINDPDGKEIIDKINTSRLCKGKWTEKT